MTASGKRGGGKGHRSCKAKDGLGERVSGPCRRGAIASVMNTLSDPVAPGMEPMQRGNSLLAAARLTCRLISGAMGTARLSSAARLSAQHRWIHQRMLAQPLTLSSPSRCFRRREGPPRCAGARDRSARPPLPRPRPGGQQHSCAPTGADVAYQTGMHTQARQLRSAPAAS